MIEAWLALAAAIAAPPPPMITTVPTPPIIREGGRIPAETLTFTAAIRHGANLIWQGKLAMASNGSASYTQRRDQSLACPDRASGRQTRFSTGTALTLNPDWGMEGRSSVRVSATLERPAPDDAPLAALCQNLTTRKVQIDASIRPEHGKPVTLQGDADFSVTLTLD